jgi:tetratricopeptide (TPR) repeat protein
MMTGNYEDAIAGYEQLVERKSTLLRACVRLAGLNAVLGNDNEAREYVSKALGIKPELTVQGWKKFLYYRNPENLERELSWLRQAGLPEGDAG